MIAVLRGVAAKLGTRGKGQERREDTKPGSASKELNDKEVINDKDNHSFITQK